MSEPVKRHKISGVVIKDDKFYIPLDEVIRFCRRFSTISSQKIGDIFYEARRQLSEDSERLKKVPKVEERSKKWYNIFDN